LDVSSSAFLKWTDNIIFRADHKVSLIRRRRFRRLLRLCLRLRRRGSRRLRRGRLRILLLRLLLLHHNQSR